MADKDNDLVNITGSKKPDETTPLKLKKLPHITSDDMLSRGKGINTTDPVILNNWAETNINTLRVWKGSLRQALYIYNDVLEKLKKKLNHYDVVILILGIFATLISSISTYALINTSKLINTSNITHVATNMDTINIDLGIVISVTNLIIGAIITILKGLIKLYNLDDYVSSYTLYLERLDQLYSTIANQLTLPTKLRQDAFDFITAENEIYLKLIKESPEIATTDYNIALDSYHKYLQDESANQKFTNSYNNDDNIIEVV